MVCIPREMETLQKLFKSKFKQQALDGDSKYAKMNLEDSNPENLPAPLKICSLTMMNIKSFRVSIYLIIGFWAIYTYGGFWPFGANQEGISLLISVTYELIQQIAYF